MAPTPGPSREALSALITEQRRILEESLAKLSPRQMTQVGITDEGWSAKDLMAHLAAWEQMFLGWYMAGVRGEEPQTPAPGFSWSSDSLAKLNDRIFRQYHRSSLADVRRFFDQSHTEVLEAFAHMSADDLSTPGRYAWTGKGTLAGAVTANTWRHYRWARTLIVKRFTQ